ncbi:MAG TPA: hypothetical protein DEP18_01545 [Flavobacteriales bacterium]|nr:hypothetical protein [Flavobacteriales bacterium]HCA82441.1 hypothetical protein [Flavobacteriales bacterium]HRE75878.1 hypothetical protein [Flavobacteriales bacterium]HRE97348.1 hypothetical protein [Flavobacteriales bacterium]HRJ34400.1 hypothetical protein [Flavobacteriales bacterium]
MEKKIRSQRIEKGIVENYVLEDMHIEPEDLDLCKSDNLALMGDELYTVLVVSGSGSTISAEARKKVASPEYRMNTVAKAFLVENLAHRIIGNFYMTFNKPAIPTRLFTDREKALEWLRQELKINTEKAVGTEMKN